MTGLPGTFWAMVWTLVRCGAVTTPTADCASAEPSSDLVLGQCNNYSQTSTIALGHYEVQSQPSELTVDWAGLTEDLRGRPVVSGDVDTVLLSQLYMTEAELLYAIEQGDLSRSSAFSWAWGNAAHGTTMHASELETAGNRIDLTGLVSEEGTLWALSLLDSPDGIAETRFVTAVLLDPVEEGPDTISIESGASAASGTADLHSNPALLAEEGAGSYTLDWSSLETDVFGRPFDTLVANTLVILNYPGTVSDAEADFLLLDYNATALYALDVFGVSSTTLEDALDEDGTPFPGFTTDGTWLVGLVDAGSLSPVPLVMAVVAVE